MASPRISASWRQANSYARRWMPTWPVPVMKRLAMPRCCAGACGACSAMRARWPSRCLRRWHPCSGDPVTRWRRGRWPENSLRPSKNTRRGGATGCVAGTRARTATTGRHNFGGGRRAAWSIAAVGSTVICRASMAPAGRCRTVCRRACSPSPARTSHPTCCGSSPPVRVPAHCTFSSCRRWPAGGATWSVRANA